MSTDPDDTTFTYSTLNGSAIQQKDTASTPKRAQPRLHKHDTMTTDFTIPCPLIAEHCPYPCCCCCVLPRATRQQFALSILYNRSYLLVYFVIIIITLTLLIFDLYATNGNIFKDLNYEPTWFIVIDIICVFLMIFDISLQVQAHHRRYFKSLLNIFDFMVVTLCVICLPIYFDVQFSGLLLPVVLIIRFLARFLRIVVVYKHQRNRRRFMRNAQNDVDFTGFNDSPPFPTDTVTTDAAI
eukprot:135126_1